MTGQVIPLDKLGGLSKIGQGGQGVVYAASHVKTKFAASMVYKQYKSQIWAEIDFAALAAMPALVEESLSYTQAKRLIAIAAWPCALVEDGATPLGFVMPAIPEEFFIPLTTVKGASPTAAEFQHLLNHPSVLEARGIDIDDAQRYSLLREVASAVAFLHKHGVCVGDISPKNLLFSLTPPEAVYFIDCDAMRIDGVSALPQVETPGWEIPPGEELATIYSDTYKLGLLALRLVAGDHDTKNPQDVPANTPELLRQIVTDTLTNQPHQRPLPEAWTFVLGHAIEQAQHQQKMAAAASVSDSPDPPPVPVVHSRPSARSRTPVHQPYSAPPADPSAPSPSRSTSSKAPVWIAGITLAVVVAIVAVVVVLAVNKNNNGSTVASTTSSSYSSPAPTASPSATPTPAYVPPPTYTSTETPEPTTTSPAPMYAIIVMAANGHWESQNNASDLDTATQSAMSRCQAKAGICARIAWRENGCVAAAWNGRSGYGGSGSTRNEAEQHALNSLHGGYILTSLCTS
jgi:serine/threonine protein kinase